MNMRRLVAGLITTLSVVATAACSAGAPADRAGGEIVTLRLGFNRQGQSGRSVFRRPGLRRQHSRRFRAAASRSRWWRNTEAAPPPPMLN